jgi:poly(3-hydroxyalkanoate) depolymerase
VARAGEGRPLLLINGLGAGLEMWTPFASRLAAEREVIAFDLPGSGHSPPGRWPARMKGLAGLVEGLLDQLELPTVDLLGYSLGGVLAQEVAHRSPQRVSRLILAATTPGVPSVPPNPLAAALMLTPARYWSRGIAERIIPIIAGGRTARDRGVLGRGIDWRLADPPSTRGYLQQMYALTLWSSHPWLHRLRQPTLVVHGDHDPLVPLFNARYLARAIPDARLHVIAGGGHLFLLDQPDDAIAAISPFLVAHAGGLDVDLTASHT